MNFCEKPWNLMLLLFYLSPRRLARPGCPGRLRACGTRGMVGTAASGAVPGLRPTHACHVASWSCVRTRPCLGEILSTSYVRKAALFGSQNSHHQMFRAYKRTTTTVNSHAGPDSGESFEARACARFGRPPTAIRRRKPFVEGNRGMKSTRDPRARQAGQQEVQPLILDEETTSPILSHSHVRTGRECRGQVVRARPEVLPVRSCGFEENGVSH